MISIVSATVRGGGGVYIMFVIHVKIKILFVQGNLAKSWGCVDFSFNFSLGSHLTQ